MMLDIFPRPEIKHDGSETRSHETPSLLGGFFNDCFLISLSSFFLRWTTHPPAGIHPDFFIRNGQRPFIQFPLTWRTSLERRGTRKRRKGEDIVGTHPQTLAQTCQVGDLGPRGSSFVCGGPGGGGYDSFLRSISSF